MVDNMCTHLNVVAWACNLMQIHNRLVYLTCLICVVLYSYTRYMIKEKVISWNLLWFSSILVVLLNTSLHISIWLLSCRPRPHNMTNIPLCRRLVVVLLRCHFDGPTHQLNVAEITHHILPVLGISQLSIHKCTFYKLVKLNNVFLDLFEVIVLL